MANGILNEIKLSTDTKLRSELKDIALPLEIVTAT